MAIIKPFKGVRPPQELVEQVASRPYEVLILEEALTDAAGNVKVVLQITQTEISLHIGTSVTRDSIL